ncbi:hypothetical protein D0Z00_000572 [Geotrichum galactomycetum]|uniref:Uncharacterized protein n=1 Tax=Geotrichum galactomycetum TaxID=27317 RepID=A0ACB6V9G1_9ASCO|nr:hypothetical protein D0Z00_000572 [Geotrichum candidum]
MTNSRPLSIAEASSAYRHILNVYLTISVSASLKHPTKTAILPSQLLAAVKPIVLEHPALAALLQVRDSKYYQVIADKVDLAKNIIWREQSDLDTLEAHVCQQTSEQFPNLDSVPGWRLWITPLIGGEVRLNFFFHHSLFDGTSAQDFLVKLTENLNSQAESLAKDESVDYVLEIPASVEPTPSFEVLLGLKDLRLTGPVKGFTPPDDANTAFWAGTPVFNPFDKPALTKSIYNTISAEDLKKLVVKTKQYKTSITSVISAAVLYSLQKALQAKGKNYPKATCTIPRNTRAFVEGIEKHGKTPYGDFVSSIPVESTATNIPDLWKDSAVIRNVIQGYIDRGVEDATNEFINVAGDQRELYERRIGEARTFSVEVSTVLISNRPASPSGWTLDNFRFLQGISSEGPPILCSAVSYVNGPLVLSYSYADKTVGDASIVEGTAKEFDNTIAALIHS